MDFFSGNEIVLLIWGIGILHFIFRWMKERRSSDRSTEGTPREENGYSIPETPLPRPSSYGAGKDNDKEYNYKELRERVLRSWGMKDVRSDEMDLPDEMERSVYREAEAPAAVSIMECSRDTENRFHQYLSKPLRERKQNRWLWNQLRHLKQHKQRQIGLRRQFVHGRSMMLFSENHAEEGRGHSLSGIER